MPRPHPALVRLAAGTAPDAVPDADDGLLASATSHGMQGLLWTWVRDHAPAYSARTTLAGLDAVTRRRHGQLWDTLVGVRRDLAAIGVDVATLKGVTAEARWYTRTGERPCSDVDVLVAPEHTARVGEILAVLQPDHPLRREIDELVRSNVLQSVNARVGDTSVDLHFDLLKLGIPTRQRELVWERTVDHPLPDGTTVRVPDAEMSLVNFLVHLNKDGFARLLGYADIARILHHEDLDWAFVERFLRGEGLEVIGDAALGTVTDRLGLTAPRLAPRRARARVWHAVWPERVTLLGGTGTTRSRRQDLLPFLARGRLGDALRSTGRIAFPPPRTVALRYPDVPGPYLWRLTRGRIRTAGERRTVLRARHAPPPAAPEATGSPDPPGPQRDPYATARLLRRRAEAEPLWLDVHGGSMGWSIRSGARVRVEPRDTPPRRGEVWAFTTAWGDIVVHRALGPVATGHRFQGDARGGPDDPVSTEQLIGRVVEVDGSAAPRWGSAAGAVQRLPRIAVAATARRVRRIRPGADA